MRKGKGGAKHKSQNDIGDLRRRVSKWMKVLRLNGWDIRSSFKSFAHEEEDEDGLSTAAQVDECLPDEQIAVVDVATDYWTKKGFGVSFNLDTLVLHELIHVILWDKFKMLPKSIRESKRMEDFEEFICFRFARLIYEIWKR